MLLVDAELASLYGKLPPFECKGLCAHSCHTRIACSYREREKVEAAGKRPLKREADGTCSMLEHGRCVAHADRPMICRLWGMERSMRCPHGCEPILSEAQAIEFLRRAVQIGGGNYILSA